MNKQTLQISTLLLLLAASTSLFTAGCKDKGEDTQGEVITRVQVHLTGINGGFDQEFEAKDPDGDGIFNTIDEITIPAGAAYNCHLHVYDDSKTPIEDLTEEIEAENVDHLFVLKGNTAGLSIANLNTDNNGAPFGLESIWTSGAAATGTVQIKLIHEPTDKNATDPGGDTDFDVTFTVKVQ